VKVTSAGLIRTVWSTRVFRLLTWCCVISLAVLTLLPKEEMARTGLPARLEHVIAYAGSAAVATAAYRCRWTAVRVVGSFWVYAGILEYLQQLSPGRHAAVEDVAAGALGALLGGLAITVLGARFARLLPR
jgi:VanZ family protein